jgi:hypothetical protein
MSAHRATDGPIFNGSGRDDPYQRSPAWLLVQLPRLHRSRDFVGGGNRHRAVRVPQADPRARPVRGIIVEPCPDTVGLRGSMLARITFGYCRVPQNAVVGRPESGSFFVASPAFDIGPYGAA